ncbi:long-chain fatty acid-CoA ligase, variant 2 [Entomophthora muscae]|uniref:Long-chain fatty acid-CoA ligase, variant 2 n=1 Tax=Entomophthora muscae TaxID=34485 RepID=A0ACC2U3H6_9FUNG|nr:long-chain fatty acid-CoA ligase, variant 2 [Entomophthora muscae]
MLIDLISVAMFFRRAVVTTVYDTLGEEGLLHGLTQCESSVLYLAAEQLHILRRLSGKTSYLKNVIYTGSLPSGFDLKAEFPDYKCYSWDELLDLGKANPTSPDPPKPDDLAIVMYTSGSTGPPKGAMLKHSQLVSAVAGMRHVFLKMVDHQDVYISFLPLSHILAFISNTHAVVRGIRIGFSSPRTLMDSNVRNCCGDLTALKPTIIASVPQVLDTIRKDILNKLNGKSPSMGQLSAVTGGRIRLGICGAAPLSAEVSSFYESYMFPVYQGYGMSETCGVGSIAHADLPMSHSSVGQLLPSVEIKLVDVPDAGYFAKENVGELWMRGPCVFSGYFKNPKATAEAIEADGKWLRTGDIVRIENDGRISIIDRRKNLVKLINGEYIAIEKLESVYRNCIYVQTICIFANSFLRRPVAIVLPNLPALANYAKTNGLTPPRELTEVSGNEQLTQEVFQACMTEATNLKLNSSEKLSCHLPLPCGVYC